VETAIAAVIAVIGTLLGSALTYHFQQKVTERAASLGVRERTRQERLEAYAAFGGAAVRYRIAGQDVYHRQVDGSDEETQRLTRAEFYRARAELTDAELRVQLLTTDADLDALMADVITTATALRRATDNADINRRNDTAKAALSRFVEAAARHLGRPSRP
jgi:type II secretory pathway pseudopilin PulG